MLLRKRKLILFLTSCLVTVAGAAVAFTSLNENFKNYHATGCEHEVVEHYDLQLDSPTSGAVEHWACCSCHTAWADEARTIELCSTIGNRENLNFNSTNALNLLNNFYSADYSNSGLLFSSTKVALMRAAGIQAVAMTITSEGSNGWLYAQPRDTSRAETLGHPSLMNITTTGTTFVYDDIEELLSHDDFFYFDVAPQGFTKFTVSNITYSTDFFDCYFKTFNQVSNEGNFLQPNLVRRMRSTNKTIMTATVWTDLTSEQSVNPYFRARNESHQQLKAFYLGANVYGGDKYRTRTIDFTEVIDNADTYRVDVVLSPASVIYLSEVTLATRFDELNAKYEGTTWTNGNRFIDNDGTYAKIVNSGATNMKMTLTAESGKAVWCWSSAMSDVSGSWASSGDGLFPTNHIYDSGVTVDWDLSDIINTQTKILTLNFQQESGYDLSESFTVTNVEFYKKA